MLRRRDFLEMAAPLIVAAALPVTAGCGAPGSICSNEEILTTPERMLRVSHEYIESSPHGRGMSCARCQFFLAGPPETCGSCEILGGPINPAGHCDAWAEKT